MSKRQSGALVTIVERVGLVTCQNAWPASELRTLSGHDYLLTPFNKLAPPSFAKGGAVREAIGVFSLSLLIAVKYQIAGSYN